MSRFHTIEFLGIREHLNNPDFKPVEFDGFKKQAGLNEMGSGHANYLGILKKDRKNTLI